jgi:hypothetical protein
MRYFAIATMSVATIYTLKSLDWRGYASKLCELASQDPEIDSDLARDAFANTNVETVPCVRGHTHATAAALRTSATNFAKKMAMYSGSHLYVVGMSKSDQRKGLKGSRQWYWAKDTNADNRADEPAADDIEYICDVDYYLDIPDMISRRAKPTLLYTVVPESASSNGINETSTRFDEDGALETLVAGGGSYKHYLWDYSSDSVIAVSYKIGVPWKIIPYAVERKQVGVNRQLILLSPIRVFTGFSALLAYFLLDGKHVERFNPIVEGTDGSKFVRFAIHKSEGTFVTTARPMSQLCATVPLEIDDAIGTVARLGSTKLMLPTTASWTGKDDRMASAILTEYHRLVQPKILPVVYPVSMGVRAYQYDPVNYSQEERPKLEAFMSPLVHAAFAPVPNKAGEEQCVKGRITSLRKEEPRPHAFRDRCIEEFAEFVVHGVCLEPVCYEVVEEKQTSATQKMSLARATVMGKFRKQVIKCFIKSEAYADVKDPRNISTYNDGDKLDMAEFALALAKHCKQFSWYGPGKTPIEIAERVAAVCSNADFVNISDYHRMDGTITHVLRQVDRAVCMKAYVNHRAKLNQLLKTNADNQGFLPLGTTFDQGPSHGSGCSATSLFQTLRAAFTAYLGFRHATFENGRKLTAEEAFQSLGCHLGDDGIDAQLPVDAHTWAAGKVGLILEASTVSRGCRGVNFLARYYASTVWTGCTDSMCDAKRQLSKFHVTVRLPEGCTPEQKLVEKCMSYLATDSNTPVIGAFCKRVLLLSTYRPRVLLGIGNWWSKFEESVQYPNRNVDGWMDVEFDNNFPEFDRDQFDRWLVKTECMSQILSAPLCAEPRAATPALVDVVVDDQVIPARKEPKPTPKEPKRKPRKTKEETSERKVSPPMRKRMKKRTDESHSP